MTPLAAIARINSRIAERRKNRRAVADLEAEKVQIVLKQLRRENREDRRAARERKQAA